MGKIVLEGNRKVIEDKILFFIKNRCYIDANHLFKETFTQESPPAKNLVLRMFLEYKNQEAYVEAFDFLRRVIPWFPEDPELVEAEKLARRLLYDLLVVKGNAIRDSALAKTREILEISHSVGKGHRQKLIEENQKSVISTVQKAIEVFREAHELIPDGIDALWGMYHCYQDMGRHDEAAEYQTRIKALTDLEAGVVASAPANEASGGATAAAATTGRPPPEVPPLEKVTSVSQKIREIDAHLDEANRHFLEDRADEALAVVERILAIDPDHLRGLLLGLRCHLDRRHFHQAEKYLERAMRLYPTDEDVQLARSRFAEGKYNALTDGGSEFLRKGIELGPMLGNQFFESAIRCFEQAVAINPEDILVLDQLFTALQFMGREDKARHVRVEIYQLDPGFVTTWEKSQEQSLCFLAGMAFADEPAAVAALRTVRREWLTPFRFGRVLLRGYVRFSPLLVRWWSGTGWPVAPWRWLLRPAVLVGGWLHHRRRRRFAAGDCARSKKPGRDSRRPGS